MKALLLSVLLALPAHAAGPVVYAQSQSGERIELFKDPGPCVAGAMLARWVSADASAFVQGCWRSHDGVVEVAFLDGDSVRIPTAAFRAPTAL